MSNLAAAAEVKRAFTHNLLQEEGYCIEMASPFSLSSEENTKDLSDRQLLEMLLKKVDGVHSKLKSVEQQMKAFDNRLVDLENGVSFIEQEYEDQKKLLKTVKGKVDAVDITYVNNKLSELENYSRKNNIILRNLPEGIEDGVECKSIVETFIQENLDIDVELEVAHCTPGQRKEGRTRVIHARCLHKKERDSILQNRKKLKGKKFNGNNVFISDDVDEATRIKKRRCWKRPRRCVKEGPLPSYR